MIFWLNEFLLVLASAFCWAGVIFIGSDFTRWYNKKKLPPGVDVLFSTLMHLFRGLMILVPILIYKERFSSDEQIILALVIACGLTLIVVVATNKLDVRN